MHILFKIIIFLVTYFVFCFCLKSLFNRAGQDAEGMMAFAPVYNVILLSKLIGLSPMLLLLFLIPGVIVIAYILYCIFIIAAFNQKAIVTIFLVFFPLLTLLYMVYINPNTRYMPKRVENIKKVFRMKWCKWKSAHKMCAFSIIIYI